VGCSPSFSTTRSTTQRTSRADSSSAAHSLPAELDRRRVSHPTLEAANDARRVDPGETRGGLADGHAPVPGEVQHRRHGAAARTERHDLRVARPLRSGGRPPP
jgi:hypothetical protein